MSVEWHRTAVEETVRSILLGATLDRLEVVARQIEAAAASSPARFTTPA
jgi:hypothetical protein